MQGAIYTAEFAADMHRIFAAEFYLEKLFGTNSHELSGRVEERWKSWMPSVYCSANYERYHLFYSPVIHCDTEYGRLKKRSMTENIPFAQVEDCIRSCTGLTGSYNELVKRMGVDIQAMWACTHLENGDILGIGNVICPILLDSPAQLALDKNTYIDRFNHYSDYLCPELRSSCSACGGELLLTRVPRGKTVTTRCKRCGTPNHVTVPLSFDGQKLFDSLFGGRTSGGKTSPIGGGTSASGSGTPNRTTTPSGVDGQKLSDSLFGGRTSGGKTPPTGGTSASGSGTPNRTTTPSGVDGQKLFDSLFGGRISGSKTPPTGGVTPPTGSGVPSSGGTTRTVTIGRPEHAVRDLLDEEGVRKKMTAVRNMVKDAAKIHVFLDDQECGVISAKSQQLEITMNEMPHSLRFGKVGKTFVFPTGTESYDAIFFENELWAAPKGDPFLTALVGYILELFRGKAIRSLLRDPNNEYHSVRIRYERDGITLYYTPLQTRGLRQWASGYVEKKVSYASMNLGATPPDAARLPSGSDYWKFVENAVMDILTEDSQADVCFVPPYGFTQRD